MKSSRADIQKAIEAYRRGGIDVMPPDPQFVSSPREALQCYADLIDTRGRMEPFVGSLDCWPYEDPEQFKDFKTETDSLPVFFWSRETSKVVAQASETYPIGGDMYLPGMLRAMCVFEAPTLGAVIDGKPMSFSAISWSANRYPKTGAIALSIVGYAWHGNTTSPVWWMDVGLGVDLPDDSYLSERNALMRWIHTASMFMEQEIIGQSATRIGGQSAKRAERMAIDPTINVVSLRRVNRGQYHGNEGCTDRDWQHRWLVRGHWRKQWYPKAERNVPIFISPYIKGPEDKPLKAPAATVFAVTR